MVFCVGLTGTVASGKSTVAGIFSQLGVECISSDTLAKELTVNGEPAFDAIVEYFGQAIKMKNGTLNRRQLRDLIFTDEASRLWLEKLLHPLIRKKIVQKIAQVQSIYCIIEIPLLYNKSDFPYLNTILGIKIPDALAITRVMQRDHCSKAQAEAILALQKNKIYDDSLMDHIIVNTGSLELLEETIFKLHRHFLWKAHLLTETR